MLLHSQVDANSIRFEVDPENSDFAAHTKKAGLLSGLGHDHIIGSSKSKDSAKGFFIIENGQPKSGQVEIATSELVVLDTAVDDDDRKEILESLRSEKGLSIKKFPKIRFLVESFQQSQGQWIAQGNLHLHGVEKPISVPVRIRFADYGKSAEVVGSFKINQSDFGIEPFSAAMGTIKVADPVLVKIRMLARKQ